MDDLPNEISEGEPHYGIYEYIAFGFTLIAFFVCLQFLILRDASRNLRRGILILGLAGSGKTLIFSHLTYKKYVGTHTSIKENIGDYIIRNSVFQSSLQIIDVPGHERLRTRYIEQYKCFVRGIIFVVDASTFGRTVRDVAEFMFSVLSDPVLTSVRPQILIACHKQDYYLAKARDTIQTTLEKELNTLRDTKLSQLKSTGDPGSKIQWLGKKGENFKFSHMYPITVSFVETSAMKQDDRNRYNLNDVKMWLNKLT